MEKFFWGKGRSDQNEYLKSMLNCIDENGNLSIGRYIDEDEEGWMAFCTAVSDEDMTHIETISLDKNLADFESIWQYFEYVVSGLQDGSFWEQNASTLEQGEGYSRRMLCFARRVQRLMELNAPKFLIEIERQCLIDSIVLYKTNAKGELTKIQKCIINR